MAKISGWVMTARALLRAGPKGNGPWHPRFTGF
jgi:hypothetical protein